MEIQQLKAFIKVVETGGFTPAAEQLNTQKSAISKKVTQLERQLGVRLLERSTRAISVTDIGQEIYQRANQIIQLIDETIQIAQKNQESPQGVLKLSCSIEMGSLWVNDWITRYLQQFPHMRVEADFTNRLVDLVHEGFDLAIRIGKLEDSNWIAKPIGTITYGIFAAPSYLSKMPPPLTPHDLLNHRYLSFGNHTKRAALILYHRQLNSQPHNPKPLLDQPYDSFASTQTPPIVKLNLIPTYIVNHVTSIKNATIAGLGVAVLPLVGLQSAIEEGHLIRLLPDWQPAPQPVNVLLPSAKYISPKVRKFIEWAQQTRLE